MMQGNEVREIRESLGKLMDVHFSQKDLGIMLNLAAANAADTIRTWETVGPSGPGGVALRQIRTGLEAHRFLPEFIVSEKTEQNRRYLVRLWYPRFGAQIINTRLGTVEWIDESSDPEGVVMFRSKVLERARAFLRESPVRA